MSALHLLTTLDIKAISKRIIDGRLQIVPALLAQIDCTLNIDVEWDEDAAAYAWTVESVTLCHDDALISPRTDHAAWQLIKTAISDDYAYIDAEVQMLAEQMDAAPVRRRA